MPTHKEETGLNQGKLCLSVGAAVISADEVVAEPCQILIRDGRIEAVWRGGTTPAQIPVEYVRVQRPRAVAIPGLVNCHGHAAMTLLRGAGDDLPLQRWLEERIFPLEARLTGEAVYWGTLLACWEMIRSGTTCFTDMYMWMDDAARAVAESGLRGVLSWGIAASDPAGIDRAVATSRAFADRWHRAADGRITVTLGPHAPYTCSPECLRRVAELSAELNLPIQIHLSETWREVEECRAQFGRSPIAHALATGLLERPVLAAHCVHVDDDDIRILREKDVRVAHNPQSNLKLASGVAPVPKLLAEGVTVGLGTDGAASNNNLDMFEELRLAATLHKGVSGDATAVPAADALAMATSAGARAVFLPPGHGTLQPGAAADLVLLDLDSPHLTPGDNLVSDIVYAAGADDVTDVYVAGRCLLSNRELTTLDAERIRYEVRRIRQAMGAPGGA
ncbi:MAG: amidohydrolase [Alicyclobacillaceae bacterium]|nr:amidohydrolase [Alicyclobacillaceae bacterium]